MRAKQVTAPRQLRPYQTEAVNAVLAYWGTAHDTRRWTPIVVLPTGTGKSTVIAKLATTARDMGQRVVMLAHRRELLDQMAASVAMVDPTSPPVGIVQGERNLHPQAGIVAASFQTLQSPARLESIGKRDVVLVDECFVAGTLVDGVPIQNIRPGDMVTAVSPSGDVATRRVVHTMRSTPSALVKVSLSTGESFVCTPGHPFLTPGGWCPAGKLSNGVWLHHAQASREPAALHSVWETSRHDKETSARSVAQKQKGVLLEPVQGSVRKDVALRDNGTYQPKVRFGTNAEEQPYASGVGTEENVRVSQTKGALPAGSRRERNGANRTATSAIRGARLAYRGGSCPARRGAALSLQGRHCAPESETVRGSGRLEPQHDKAPRTGSTPGPAFNRVRVDNVTVLEPGSDGRYGGLCPDGYVYNLEVDTDHTYTVGSGVTVHNCHHAAAPTYMSVLDRMGVVSPDPLSPTWACGFTATAHREDGGLGQVWDSVVYERSLVWAIRQGYLVRPRGLTVVLPGLDLSKVTVRAGDYAQGELEEAMTASTETTVMAMFTHAEDRRPIVFAAGVCHAEELAHALTKHGITAAAVTGAMSTSEREDVYNQFRDGALRAMVTVQVLTEGADFPMCDTVVMARPTRSQTLYSQMVGRAVRLHEGKKDALVLDLAGTVRDMSLITLSNLDPTLKAKRVSVDSTEDPGQKEPVKRERKERLGAVDLEDWDLVAASVSKANWLRTPGGIRFLDGQNNVLVFLWPENDGFYSVGLMHTPQQPGVDGFVCSSLGLKDAILVAEDVLKGYGKFPLRSAAWRRKGKPSEAQLRMARCLGIPDAGKKTRARLSDDISTVLAARLLDPYLKGN